MRAVAAISVALVGGCTFGVHGLPAGEPRDLAVADLTESTPPDLADDAALPAPDLSPDPCATSAPLDGGVAVGLCILGGTPPLIDGVLDDWSGVAFVPIRYGIADVIHASSGGPEFMAWSTPPAVDANLSGAFAMRWDASNLYIAVRVTDDVRGVAGGALYASDGVELYLNGDAHPATAALSPNGYQITITVDNRLASYRDGSAIALPSGVTIQHATAQGSGGSWTLEVKVPWMLLGFATASAGRAVGWDIVLNDDDGGTTRERWLTWKDAPLVAGGYGCTCSNGDYCFPYCDARNWSQLVLGPR